MHSTWPPFRRCLGWTGTLALACSLSLSRSAEPPGSPTTDDRSATVSKRQDEAKKQPASNQESWPTPVARSWTRVARDQPLWIDLKKKEVIIGGRIALTRGQLEMFACPKGTKEHESVVAVFAAPRLIHGALLAVGARPGHPVRFEPKYEPASGSTIEVDVVWRDPKTGKIRRVRGQELVRDVKSGKAMSHEWVFGGSGFWTDEETGKRYYYADGGEFICLSNFGTAMLDLPIRSSAANDALLFRAFTERLPPRGTRVWLVLHPRTATPAGKPSDSHKPHPSSEKKKGRDVGGQ